MKDFLEWETIAFKKQNGNEKLPCPNCAKGKGDRSLSVVHSKGFAKCHRCEILSFRESLEKKEVEYTLPKQDWKNYTKLSDQMVKYLETRSIPQSVAIELGWTEEKNWQPAMSKEVQNLVYNFFEGEKIVNKKYRSGGKKFTQSAGGKPILYNINSTIEAKEVYIVEGEMDVAALYAVGIKNVVSVPNGANDNDDYWKNSKEYIEEIQSFVIAVDMDEKGQALKESIAQRLGRYRCSYVEWEGKDANDDLISGVLDKTAKNKKRFPVSGTLTIDDLYDGVIDLYDNGLPSTLYPKSKSFGLWSKYFSLMRGQLTTVTGIPSHGKSTFTDWYVLNLVNDYGLKASWFSPEHSPTTLFQTRIIEQATGANFWGKSNGVKCPRITKKTINDYREWAQQKIYFTECDKGQLPTFDWLFDKFKEQMYSFGIDIFVVDAFNKLILPKGREIEGIRRVLTQLTSFAQANNVIILLVAHPTKMHKNDKGIYPVPTLYDVAGSADFRNMTHNGFTVYRNFENEEEGVQEGTSVINMKTKFNFQGTIGEAENFNYNHLNGRFYVGNPDNDSLFGEKRIEIKVPVMTLQDAFDYPEQDLEDEVPF
jgi:twinkle protein